MLSVASSAGIDVGKQYLDVGFFPAAKPLRVVNEPTGIAKIVSVLRARGVGKVVLEAIGSYARKVICALVEAGFQVFVVNPRRIKAFRVGPCQDGVAGELAAVIADDHLQLAALDHQPVELSRYPDPRE